MITKKHFILDQVEDNMLVPIFLMTSYLYYIKDESVIPDEVYDSLCKRLLDRWNKIEHFHKHLISKEALSAGTGFNMKETDYPERVKSAAKKWKNFYF
tara:strand:- start:149 stop:442 length:294 start_codon:yes stop_codon:yes gene_type:complete